jgi:hypothetical protein
VPIPATPLQRCLTGIEAHLSASGWDQPARLYALVDGAALAAAEPGLHLAVDPGALVPVEQEPLPQDRPLDEVLAAVGWPPTVDGCALAVERLVLPPSAEAGLPGGPGVAGADVVAAAQAHPDRQDVRLVVGVLRSGERACAVRLRGYEADEQLVLDPDSAPALVDALLATLRPEP